MPSGDSVTEYTFFDANDTLYGTSTLLGSAFWTSSGVPGGTGPDTVGENIYAPYSLTEVYAVSMPIPTQLLSTIDLQTAPLGRAPFIPETSTWAMLQTSWRCAWASASKIGWPTSNHHSSHGTAPRSASTSARLSPAHGNTR